MGSVATLLAEDSGGGSFDEVWSGLWISLQSRSANVRMARACPIVNALEYRGQADVFDDISQNKMPLIYMISSVMRTLSQVRHRPRLRQSVHSHCAQCLRDCSRDLIRPYRLSCLTG